MSRVQDEIRSDPFADRKMYQAAEKVRGAGLPLIAWADLRKHANPLWAIGPDDVVYVMGGDVNVHLRPVSPLFDVTDAYALREDGVPLAALKKVDPTLIDEWNRTQAELEEGRQAARAARQAAVDEFAGRKEREYHVARIPGTVLKHGVHLPTLRDELARLGVKVTQSAAGRILASSPAGGGPLRGEADRFVDIACRYGTVVVSKKTGCDVPKCAKAGEWITDSGAVICGKHAQK